MKRYLFSFAAALFLPLFFSSAAMASDWKAFSIIEKNPDGKTYKETVILVNGSAKTVTLKMPHFEFPGHGPKSWVGAGLMGDLVLAPGDAVRFVHDIPLNRKDEFTTSMGVEDVDENIPVTQHVVKWDTWGDFPIGTK